MLYAVINLFYIHDMLYPLSLFFFIHILFDGMLDGFRFHIPTSQNYSVCVSNIAQMKFNELILNSQGLTHNMYVYCMDHHEDIY